LLPFFYLKTKDENRQRYNFPFVFYTYTTFSILLREELGQKMVRNSAEGKTGLAKEEVIRQNCTVGFY